MCSKQTNIAKKQIMGEFMNKWIIIVLAALWIITAVVVGINIHRQYLVSRLQLRILNNYKLMAQTDDIFKNVQDSLLKDAAATEKLIEKMKTPFLSETPFMNWLVLRGAVVILTIISIIIFWIYYRKKARE